MSNENEETTSGPGPIQSFELPPESPRHRMVLSPVRLARVRVLKPIAFNDVHITEGVLEMTQDEAKALGNSVAPEN